MRVVRCLEEYNVRPNPVWDIIDVDESDIKRDGLLWRNDKLFLGVCCERPSSIQYWDIQILSKPDFFTQSVFKGCLIRSGFAAAFRQFAYQIYGIPEGTSSTITIL